MLESTHLDTVEPAVARDERSMRVMEYAMALISLAAAVLISIR